MTRTDHITRALAAVGPRFRLDDRGGSSVVLSAEFSDERYAGLYAASTGTQLAINGFRNYDRVVSGKRVHFVVHLPLSASDLTDAQILWAWDERIIGAQLAWDAVGLPGDPGVAEARAEVARRINLHNGVVS